MRPVPAIDNLCGPAQDNRRTAYSVRSMEIRIKIVQFAHLRHEDRLSSVARVSYMHDFALRANSGYHPRRIVADGDQPARFQEINHLGKKQFSCLSLDVIVQSVTKVVTGFVRMQWKHVPQEHRHRYPGQNAPNHRSRALGVGVAAAGWLPDGYSPAASVLVDVHVVRERQSGAAAAAIAKITSNPYRIDIAGRCDLKHTQQRLGTKLRCVMQIVYDATVRVRIERILETESA